MTAASEAGTAQGERLAHEVQRQAGVDHVLHEQDVASLDSQVEVLEEPYSRIGRGLLACVPGESDEIQCMDDRSRPAQVGDEDDARLQGGDEDRLATRVVGRDLGAQLVHADPDLLRGEIHVPDAAVEIQLARSSLYRSASRAMSRL